ncbi:nuclear transport factor 2 family protein [Leclercia adecarboxylata]|uniref:YybH family protein n=1 Tax=Leclercia adecarboxylata TaxID=83655 RepID=UPI002DB8732C|nr:nuclear transport factor 2 family protein [Leclercia adecarboxylata]MEB6378052.1 nuclear transport factor 2 family protein [Leclercia adecarboxylata]
MYEHPLRQIIKACDRAISAKDFDSLMEHYAEDAALVVKPGMIVRGKDNIRSAFISISDHFQDQLIVKQGEMQIIEGGGDALVIMETQLTYPDELGRTTELIRRATYVFRLENDRWLCTIDNSYGTSVLDVEPAETV